MYWHHNSKHILKFSCEECFQAGICLVSIVQSTKGKQFFWGGCVTVFKLSFCSLILCHPVNNMWNFFLLVELRKIIWFFVIIPRSLYCVSIFNKLKFVVTATFCDWTQLQTSEEWSHASTTSLPYPGVWPYYFTSDVSKSILKVLSICCVLKVWLLIISWRFMFFYGSFLGSFNKLPHFSKTLFLCEGFFLSFFFFLLLLLQRPSWFFWILSSKVAVAQCWWYYASSFWPPVQLDHCPKLFFLSLLSLHCRSPLRFTYFYQNLVDKLVPL